MDNIILHIILIEKTIVTICECFEWLHMMSRLSRQMNMFEDVI